MTRYDWRFVNHLNEIQVYERVNGDKVVLGRFSQTFEEFTHKHCQYNKYYPYQWTDQLCADLNAGGARRERAWRRIGK